MNNIYDNGELLLGKVKKIKNYIEKLFKNGQVDEEFKVDVLNELKEYEDTDIVIINYDYGMGYIIQGGWNKSDIVKEID